MALFLIITISFVSEQSKKLINSEYGFDEENIYFVDLQGHSPNIVQAEFARYIVISGDTYLRALNRIPGKMPGPRGPVSWTIWMGLLSFIPYLGSILGVLGAVIAALVQYHDLMHIALVLMVFGVGQAFEGMFLTPWLVGDKIGLHPVAVIFAIMAGGQLFGFLGILLALPVAAVLNVLLRHVHELYKSSRIYERNPVKIEEL